MKYCSLTYNSHNIDDLIDGFVSVNVEGRGAICPELNILNFQGKDGSYIQSQNLKPRELKVHFLLKAINDKEYRKKLDKLSLLLKTNQDVKFSFGDEEGYRIGRVSNVVNPPFNQNQGKGVITIYCKKPLRFMPLKTFSGNNIKIILEDNYAALIEEISGTTPGGEVKINSSNGQIISVKNLNSGSFVLNNEYITLNNQNVVDKLDFGISTWKGFKINNNDNISIINLNNPKLKIRRLLP